MKKISILSLITLFTITTSQGQDIYSGMYLGMKSPGITPKIFAPGIISTEFHDDGAPVFAPNEKEVYFRIAGRPKSLIFKMVQKDGVWQSPVIDSIALVYNFQFSAFSSDGNKRFFSSKYKGENAENEYMEIMYIERTNKKWSSPKRVDIPNAPKGDKYFFCISKNGDIYFGADYPDGKGKMDIYVSEMINGSYSTPKNLTMINSPAVETAATISPDEDYLIFTSTRTPATSAINLWISFKKNDGEWDEPINMGKEINGNLTDKFSGLSPDGKYLFWVSHRDKPNKNPSKIWSISGITYPKVQFEGGDVYWVSTEIIADIKKQTTNQ